MKADSENAARELFTRRDCLTWFTGTAGALLAPRLSLAGVSDGLLHVAVSTETLAGANINDARAAYTVWIQEVTKHLGSMRAEVVPEIFLPSDRLIAGIRRGDIDCYGITALEYLKVADITDLEYLLVQDTIADGLEYVMLVQSKGNIKKLADLRGSQILVHHHRETVLLSAWLGTLLAASDLPQPDHFFASQLARDAVNQVILPVFFRHADAACLTRESWEVAVELNPQLGRDLIPLAVSPRLVPIAVYFRRNSSAEGRRALIDAVSHVTSVAAGQQIVALYQSRAFVVRSNAIMKTTMDMVRQYDKILAQQSRIQKASR